MRLPGDTTTSEPDLANVALDLKVRSTGTPGLSVNELRSVLAELHPTWLVRLGLNMRSRFASSHQAFDAFEADSALRLLQQSSDRDAHAATFSMHRNGHVREVAVRFLQGSTDPLVVPFVLLRCGDWVQPVSDQAMQAIEPWLYSEHAGVLLRSYPLLDGARFDVGRPAHALRKRVADLLTTPSAAPTLMEYISDSDLFATRNAIRLLLFGGKANVALLTKAMQTGDLVSTTMVSRELPMTGEVNQAAGELLVTHPTPRLRQEGVYRLLKGGGEQAPRIATQAMRDRSLSVRSTGQRWHREAGGNVAAFYRDVVAEAPLLGLLGLGDHADEADADLARSHVDGAPAVRRAALRLLAAVAATDDFVLFTDVVLGGTGRERRAALEWFRRTGMANDNIVDIYEQACLHDHEDAEARVVTQLATLTRPWTRIELGLTALNTPDSSAQQAGVNVLLSVMRQTAAFHLRPSDESLEKMRAQFARARTRLDGYPAIHDQLEHLLR